MEMEGSELFPIRIHKREANPSDQSSMHTEDGSALNCDNASVSLAEKDDLVQLLSKYAGTLTDKSKVVPVLN
jgi:hypothetical protein